MVENLFSHKEVVGKSNSLFIALIESSGYSLYIAHQKSIRLSSHLYYFQTGHLSVENTL